MSDNPISELELILKILTYTIETKGIVTIEEIDEILHLLSNRTRRRMLSELATGEGFVNELVKRLDDHPQSITRHLEVLKKSKLITGQERPGIGRRGRPRLYYALFPDLAEIITRKPSSISESNEQYICSSFPRLNAIKNQLEGRITHNGQKKMISEVQNIKKEHENALELCSSILSQLNKKVTKIPIE